MQYVYILSSTVFRERIYVGVTQDIEKRLHEHNSGKSHYTAKYAPWNVIFYAAFNTQEKALAFEKYLKTGSGRTFINSKIL